MVGEGLDASERCLIFQHHLFLVLQAGSLVCVKRLPRTPCSQTASSRNWTASVTCFKQPQDLTQSATNSTTLDEAVSLRRLIRWTMVRRKQQKEVLQPTAARDDWCLWIRVRGEGAGGAGGAGSGDPGAGARSKAWWRKEGEEGERERANAPPFQSAAAVSHGSRASGGERRHES